MVKAEDVAQFSPEVRRIMERPLKELFIGQELALMVIAERMPTELRPNTYLLYCVAYPAELPSVSCNDLNLDAQALSEGLPSSLARNIFNESAVSSPAVVVDKNVQLPKIVLTGQLATRKVEITVTPTSDETAALLDALGYDPDIPYVPVPSPYFEAHIVLAPSHEIASVVVAGVRAQLKTINITPEDVKIPLRKFAIGFMNGASRRTRGGTHVLRIKKGPYVSN